MLIKVSFEIELKDILKKEESSLLEGRSEEDVYSELQEIFGEKLEDLSEDTKELFIQNFADIFNY